MLKSSPLCAEMDKCCWLTYDSLSTTSHFTFKVDLRTDVKGNTDPIITWVIGILNEGGVSSTKNPFDDDSE